MDTRTLFDEGATVAVEEQFGVPGALGTHKVIRDSGKVISLEPERGGVTVEFAWDSEAGIWRLLFEGLGGERCTSQNAARYLIKPIG